MSPDAVHEACMWQERMKMELIGTHTTLCHTGKKCSVHTGELMTMLASVQTNIIMADPTL